jgi:hypothetical protein
VIGGGEVVSLLCHLPGKFLLLTFVSLSQTQALTVQLKRLGQLKNPMTSLGIEPTTIIQENHSKISSGLRKINFNFKRVALSLKILSLCRSKNRPCSVNITKKPRLSYYLLVELVTLVEVVFTV